MNDAQSFQVPEKPRPPEPPLPEGADCVRVTGADFNGHSFDGSPFNPAPAPNWILDAIMNHQIVIHPADTDYAQFDVVTPDGIMRATCDDRIVRLADGNLRVFKHWSNQ